MWTRALQSPATNVATFVAMHGDEVLGFASTGPFRLEPPNTADTPDTPEPGSAEGQGDGELNALYLLQSVQRQGLGRRLFEAGAQSLSAAGFGAMRCWVLERNAAFAFYERMGGLRVASKNFSVDGATLVEHCYRFDLR
jgi:GNAT superfamily N-acetyltransferase